MSTAWWLFLGLLLIVIYIVFTVLMFVLVKNNGVKWGVWGGVTGIALIALLMTLWVRSQRTMYNRVATESIPVVVSAPPRVPPPQAQVAPLPRAYLDKANAAKQECKATGDACYNRASQVYVNDEQKAQEAYNKLSNTITAEREDELVKDVPNQDALGRLDMLKQHALRTRAEKIDAANKQRQDAQGLCQVTLDSCNDGVNRRAVADCVDLLADQPELQNKVKHNSTNRSLLLCTGATAGA
jgi:hypothetical protein